MLPPLTLASGIFFASGAAALIFEALWFRRTGLAFGNSVWASALVLSAFMTGLALGNGLAARVSGRLRSPARSYAALEVAIAISGVTLVVVLPSLGPLLAPIFAPLERIPWLLQAARFALSFVVLMAPAIAMGATLPVLVHALRECDPDFGRLLGRLYGWNTLGAMAGAFSAEALWIPLGGIYGAAAVAVALNAVAAIGALALAPHEARSPAPARAGDGSLPLGDAAREDVDLAGTFDAAAADAALRARHLRRLRLLLAAALAGGNALAFEVVWFRILAQFVPNSSAMFAFMLAVVLGGIALGSLLATRLFHFAATAHRHAAALALSTAALGVASHAAIPAILEPGYQAMGADGPIGSAVLLGVGTTVFLSALLMLPVATASGVLFAWLGKSLEESIPTGPASRARATGLLALANSAGSALGPLVAGFLLLPRLGMAGATFAIAASYGAVGALAWDGRTRRSALVCALPAIAALALFPHGALERTLRGQIHAQFGEEERIVAFREGLIETAIVTRKDFAGEAIEHRLVTDGYSMTATTVVALRYMRAYVTLPAAIHPGIERALLISFGVGTTAAALVGLDEIGAIDIVDISPEILGLASVVRPDPGSNPLDDERVDVHIEDGRYFLHTTRHRYDLITAEPPPPAYAGVVNLYTREYFELIRGRLRAGGFATYWLPVSQMSGGEAKAIVAAFCGAFDDCTLWEPFAGDWMLVGSRGARGPIDEARARAQWNDPRTLPSLVEIGFERAEQLGATFLADADFLREWVADTPPLVDAHPERAPKAVPGWTEVPAEFRWSLDSAGNRKRFASSATVARWFAPELRAATLSEFTVQNAIRSALLDAPRPLDARLGELHLALTRTDQRTLPLWILRSSVARQRIAARLHADGDRPPAVVRERALGALADRRFDEAAALLARSTDLSAAGEDAVLHVYALCMAERRDEAAGAARDAGIDRDPATQRSWKLLEGTFGLR